MMLHNHKTYARFCEAHDTLIELANTAERTCSDLYYDIEEANRLGEISRKLKEFRVFVERERTRNL